jgi:hypothetical protein
VLNIVETLVVPTVDGLTTVPIERTALTAIPITRPMTRSEMPTAVLMNFLAIFR